MIALNEATLLPQPETMRLEELPAGWQPVTYTVLADGLLAVLATDVDLAGERRRIEEAVRTTLVPDPPSRMMELASAGTARILTLQPSGWVGVPVFPLESAWPLFDRFADGRWLVAASRSSGGDDARVLSAGGDLIARFNLGHGISHVAIDGDDRIWAAWYDEGVYGNPDWRVVGEDWPPSGNSVARFADDGTLLSLPAWPDVIESVGDCYALNVTDGEAWACPNSEFPIVRFAAEQRARWWRSDLEGLCAIAVAGNRRSLRAGMERMETASHWSNLARTALVSRRPS